MIQSAVGAHLNQSKEDVVLQFTSLMGSVFSPTRAIAHTTCWSRTFGTSMGRSRDDTDILLTWYVFCAINHTSNVC